MPSDKPYSIIAFFNLPYEKSLDFSQPLAIDSPSILLLVPDGIKVAGEQLDVRGRAGDPEQQLPGVLRQRI